MTDLQLIKNKITILFSKAKRQQEYALNVLHQNAHNNNDNNNNNASTLGNAPKRQQVSMAVNAAIVGDNSDNRNISSAYQYVERGRRPSSLSQQQCCNPSSICSTTSTTSSLPNRQRSNSDLITSTSTSTAAASVKNLDDENDLEPVFDCLGYDIFN